MGIIFYSIHYKKIIYSFFLLQMNKAEKIMKAFSNGDASGLVHLNTKQADAFIDYIVDESVLLGQMRIKRMDTPKATIGKLGIGSKVFYPATRGTALDTSKRVQATAGSIELESKEIIAEVFIYDDEVEDNIEGTAFKEHLMRMIASQGRNQLEEAVLYGRKVADAEDINQLFDGILYRALTGGVVVDGADTNLFTDRFIEKPKLSKMYTSIPTKYQKGLTGYFLPNNLIVNYNDKYETTSNTVDKRGANGKPFIEVPLLDVTEPVPTGASLTIASDAAAGQKNVVLSDASTITAGDVFCLAYGKAKQFASVVASKSSNTLTLTDNLPFDYESSDSNENFGYECTLDGASGLLANSLNFIWGVQREITVEPQRDARLRGTLFVITMRMDVQVENAEAICICKNMKSK